MTDFFSALPILAVFISVLLVMLVVVAYPRFSYPLHLAAIGVFAALVLVVISLLRYERETSEFFAFFVGDTFSKVTQGALLAATLVVLVISREWSSVTKDRGHAYAILLLISLVGAMALVMSTHFLSFFISLELLSIPVYAMIAYEIRQRRALEAGLKYILLAGFSVAILLFGAALIYAQTGSLQFEVLAEKTLDTLGFIGYALFFVGIAFKVGLVPFHMWLPDVYEGAPLPVTAFLATVSKGAVLFFLVRFLSLVGMDGIADVVSIIAALSVLSMFLGNILALKQNNLKRLLAYSSIAQVGYIFIAILTSDSHAVLFYVCAYFVAVLCALFVITLTSHFDIEKESIRSLDALYFSQPRLAIALTVALLSFTGLPLTVGFLSKFFLLTSAAYAAQWSLAISLIVSSAIGFYAYFKIILAMATRSNLSMLPRARTRPSFSELTILVLTCLILALGVWPQPLDDVATAAALESSDPT